MIPQWMRYTNVSDFVSNKKSSVLVPYPLAFLHSGVCCSMITFGANENETPPAYQGFPYGDALSIARTPSTE